MVPLGLLVSVFRALQVLLVSRVLLARKVRLVVLLVLLDQLVHLDRKESMGRLVRLALALQTVLIMLASRLAQLR
jgi:hypothetical protein